MTLSSYQIERLLQRLKRVIGWPSASVPSERDRVQVSRVTRQHLKTRGGPQGQASKVARVGGGLREQSKRHPVIEAERERRAGSFMEPPYPQEPPPNRIPRLRREGDV